MDLYALFPPYLALHSIEYLGLVTKSLGHRVPKPEDVKLVISLYNEIENNNPYYMLLLDAPEDGEEAVFLLLTDLTHRGFDYQGLKGANRWARELNIFCECMAGGRSERLLEVDFKVSFLQWFRMTFLLFSMYSKGVYSIYKNDIIEGLVNRFSIPRVTIELFLEIMKLNHYELACQYKRNRLSTGANFEKKEPSIFELHIPSVFMEKPLLFLGNDMVYVPYKSFIPNASFAALRGLLEERCSDYFADEFGGAFQKYAKEICALMPDVIIYEEKDFISEGRQIDNQKVCDLLIVDQDAYILIECKAVYYTSKLVTLSALSKSNYVEKIKTAIQQIKEFLDSLLAGNFSKVISLDPSKKILSIVITYDGITLPNFPYFRRRILGLCDEKDLGDFPQMMDMESFEMLVTHAIRSNHSLSFVIENKLKKSYRLVGDWPSYWRALVQKKILHEKDYSYLSFHGNRMNSFVDDLKQHLK